MKKGLKIYGLENSGTNWMQKLFKDNFKGGYFNNDKYGWKHGIPEPTPEDCLVIIMIKEPYSWILSCYRTQHNLFDRKKGLSFSEAIRHEVNRVYADLPSMWAERYKVYKTYSRILGDRCWFLSYESLLNNTEHYMNKLCEHFERKSDGYVIEDKICEPKKVGDTTFDKDHYLKEKWRSEYEDVDKKDIEHINKKLGNIEQYGYTKIT